MKSIGQEEKDTIYSLYQELTEQGKNKAQIYREIAEMVGRSTSSVSSLIWRIENPEQEKEGQRRKKEKGKEQTVPREFNPEQFIQHYRNLVKENKSLKDELALLQKDHEELQQSLTAILNKAKTRYTINKDRETNNFYVAEVEPNGGEK